MSCLNGQTMASGRLRAFARRCASVLLTLSFAGGALASGPRTYQDAVGDAAYRPTSADGAQMLPAGEPIDLVMLRVGNWSTPTPLSDPYVGTFTDSASPLGRIDVVFAGVVSPPGVLTGAGQPDPFRFGARPLYAFIDFDIDNEDDTGGELTSSALNRFYANVARFGTHPGSSDSIRFAMSSGGLDYDYTTTPYFERSGADYALSFCGCTAATLESESTTPAKLNGVFEAGETMIVSGRFFQRAGGFRPASAVIGGSVPGAYDPIVRVRFHHDVESDRTTVSIVFALTQQGAAMLTGESAQPIDANVANHTSVAEAMQDIINRAQSYSTPGLTYQLIRGWRDQELDDATDAGDWRARALVGTTYAGTASSLYLWTDAGFECTYHDVNGDAAADAGDQAAINQAITVADGGSDDADGYVNGSVAIGNHPMGFSVYDVNSDGVINGLDADAIEPACAADFDQSGTADATDIFIFLDAWFAQNGLSGPGLSADIDGSGSVEATDIFVFLDAWFAGCG